MKIECGQHEKPRINIQAGDKLVIACGIVILIVTTIAIYTW